MRKLVVAFIVILLAVASSPAYAAPPSPYTNILANGNFSSSFSSWSILGNVVWDVTSGVMEAYVPTTPGVITQVTTFSASASDRYEIRLDLGNRSSVPKSVGVVLANVDFTNQITCAFVLDANSPMQTYRVRGLVPAGGWSSIRFIISFNTFDSLPAVQIDNVVVEYVPGAQFNSTICTPPATPTPTHTPAPTPTPTPNYYIEFDLGDNQYARVERTVSGGDYVIIVLLSVFLFGSAGISLLRELRGGKS